VNATTPASARRVRGVDERMGLGERVEMILLTG
jgi:hypothetical protein